jgi:hypothetical protein
MNTSADSFVQIQATDPDHTVIAVTARILSQNPRGRMRGGCASNRMDRVVKVPSSCPMSDTRNRRLFPFVRLESL